MSIGRGYQHGSPTENISESPDSSSLPSVWVGRFLFFFFNTKTIPDSSAGKESACSVGGLGSIPGSGRFPGGRHGNPLQYFYLEYPMEEGPGGLQSIELQTVEHEWSYLTCTRINHRAAWPSSFLAQPDLGEYTFASWMILDPKCFPQCVLFLINSNWSSSPICEL